MKHTDNKIKERILNLGKTEETQVKLRSDKHHSHGMAPTHTSLHTHVIKTHIPKVKVGIYRKFSGDFDS